MTLDLFQLQARLGGLVSPDGRRWRGPGPGHSRRDDSLSVRVADDEQVLFNSFAGDDPADCARHLGLDTAWRRRQREARPAQRKPALDSQRRIDLARRIFHGAGPVRGTPAETYLKRRSLSVPLGVEALRYDPHCPRGPGRSAPAMVAAMRSVESGAITGIHRTYVSADGSKAKLHEGDPAKAMLGQAAGAAVMIDGFDAVTGGLIIAEGIENALTARCGGWAPVWALGSAGAIRSFPVLAGVEALTILADADPAGRQAAASCAEHWTRAGAEVRIVEPRADGTDWNDALLAWGGS